MTKSTAVFKSILYGLFMLLFPTISGVIAGVTQMSGVNARWLQGSFLLLSLGYPFFMIILGKWKREDIGFKKVDKAGMKTSLYFFPIVLLYVPAALGGFSIKNMEFLLCNLYMFLFVGISEELYFRGIIPGILSKVFTRSKVIFLSSTLFGVGHLAGALDGRGALGTFITVVNAFIFGWMAMEVAMLSGTILPSIFIHFLFDFEPRFSRLTNQQLVIADTVRCIFMLGIAVWLFLILRKSWEVEDIEGKKE